MCPYEKIPSGAPQGVCARVLPTWSPDQKIIEEADLTNTNGSQQNGLGVDPCQWFKGLGIADGEIVQPGKGLGSENLQHLPPYPVRDSASVPYRPLARLERRIKNRRSLPLAYRKILVPGAGGQSILLSNCWAHNQVCSEVKVFDEPPYDQGLLVVLLAEEGMMRSN